MPRVFKSWWWRHRFGIAVTTIIGLMLTPWDWLCLVIAFTVVGLDLFTHDPTEEP